MPNLSCADVEDIRRVPSALLSEANVLMSGANDNLMAEVDELSEQVVNLTYQKECLTNERDFERAHADVLNYALATLHADNDALRSKLKKAKKQAKRRIRRLTEDVCDLEDALVLAAHQVEVVQAANPDYENQKANQDYVEGSPSDLLRGLLQQAVDDAAEAMF